MTEFDEHHDDIRRHLKDVLAQCNSDFGVHFGLMNSVLIDSLTVYVGELPIRLGLSLVDVERVIRELPDYSFSRLGRLIPEPFESELGPFLLTQTEQDVPGFTRRVPTRALLLADVLRTSMEGYERLPFVRRSHIYGTLRGALDAEVAIYRPPGLYQATSVILLYYNTNEASCPELSGSGESIRSLAAASSSNFFAARRRQTLYSDYFHRSLSADLFQVTSQFDCIDPDDETLLHTYARALAATTLSNVQFVDEEDASAPDFIAQCLEQGITTFGTIANNAAAMCVPVRPYTVGRRRRFDRALLLTRAGDRRFNDLDEQLATQVAARLARIEQRRQRDRRARLQADNMRLAALATPATDSDASWPKLPYGLRSIASLSGATLAYLADLVSAHSAHSVSFRVLAPSAEHPGELALWQVGHAGDAGPSRLAQDRDGGTNWKCVIEGRKVYVPSWDHSDLPVAHRSGTRSSLTVPVYDATSLIGTLNCESHRDSDFLEHVTDIMNCASLLGQAHDLTRMADWAAFVQRSSVDVNLLHNLANRVSILGNSLAPDAAARPQLIAISDALRAFYESDTDVGQAIPLSLESLLESADGWQKVNFVDLQLRGPARPILRAIVDELLMNCKEHGLEEDRRLTVAAEEFNGSETTAIHFSSLSRHPLTPAIVDRLFRTVNPNGFEKRNRVGAAQCGWLAALLGGRIDAWKGETSRDLHVVLRVPSVWFSP